MYPVFVSHAEHRSPSLDALKLILKDVAPAVASYDENYIQVSHLVQVLAAVASNLAHDLLKVVVGGYAFGESGFSSVSVAGTTSGMLYH